MQGCEPSSVSFFDETGTSITQQFDLVKKGSKRVVDWVGG